MRRHDAYRRLLRRVDSWYGRVKRSHADKVPCAVGCRDCCLGLFDVTLADRDLLRAGLETLEPAVRRDIEARAQAILDQLRQWFPRLGDTLEGLSEEEVDEICDWAGSVECPVLGKANECRLYDFRPLTCRLHGVPVIDRSGEPLHEEGCGKCRLTADEAPRMDCNRLCRDEEALLQRRYGTRGQVMLLIPQAVAPQRAP